MKRGILILILFLSLSFLSATTCNQTIFSLDGSSQKTIQCIGGNVNRTINVYAGSYVSTDSSTINGNGVDTKTFVLTFSPPTTMGIYNSYVLFDDGLNIPITFTIEEPYTGDIIVFPTSKVVTVQQGSEKTQNILVTVPQTYPRTITIQSVDFNPGTETILFGDLNLGQVAPGNTIQIPIIFSGKDAQVGTYQTNLNIFATDSEGQVTLPSINLQLQVSAGVSPVTNSTFSTKPSCSLSSTDMHLNETYTFTCSNVVQNLEVNPQYSEFFEGISVDLSGGIYTYKFKTTKYGNCNFIATFSYKGSPIFSPFLDEVRIKSTGSSTPGTNLKFLFTPKLSDLGSGEETIIQIVDNKTGSLVDSPSLYINAVKQNTTDKAFKFSFSSGKNYEMRGTSPGYNDLVQKINISSTPTKITVSPSRTFYFVGDKINITTEPIDCAVSVNGVIITYKEYTFGIDGNFTIKATKSGYREGNLTILVKKNVEYQTMTPEYSKWKKGSEVIMELTENSNWVVQFEEEYEENDQKLYRAPIQLTSGATKRVEFKIEEYGRYVVKSNDLEVVSKVVTKESVWYNPLSWVWVKNLGWWWILIIGGIVLVIFYFNNSGEKPKGELNLMRQG